MKNLKVIGMFILLIAVSLMFTINASAAEKVMWGKTELKLGQIGKITILEDTPLVKLESNGVLATVRSMKKGEEYRVYSFKGNQGGLYGLGGGNFVQKNTKVKYETPSKSKLALLKKESKPVKKVYSTKEIVDLNDQKIVLIETDSSQGSGIVIGNGLILTNQHVIEGATGATITFNDGQQFEVIGIVESDVNKDIALLKTKKFKTAGVTIRPTSNGLSKGEKVIAIGSPVGLQNTVSEGIISSFRTSEGVSYIQTNADIDHGSSGGSLFDTSGELIGMTTSVIDSGSANLNFAIASEELVPMVNKYKNKNYDSILASFPFPTTSDEAPGLGDISLGMTMEQVRNLSAGSYLSEDNNHLVYSDVTVLGYLADVIYQFQNNRLVAINVYHYVVDDIQDLDTLERFFVVLYDEVSKIYGEADELDTDWNNDEVDYHLSAYWTRPDHVTMVTVNMTINSNTFGGLSISILE